ncbi:MAG TPA: hypothetical protein VFH61_05950, partial [Thermoleophilia bacterium]|nr:hypothetical protein [Thermoleophilia bacterium]
DDFRRILAKVNARTPRDIEQPPSLTSLIEKWRKKAAEADKTDPFDNDVYSALVDPILDDLDTLERNASRCRKVEPHCEPPNYTSPPWTLHLFIEWFTGEGYAICNLDERDLWEPIPEGTEGLFDRFFRATPCLEPTKRVEVVQPTDVGMGGKPFGPPVVGPAPVESRKPGPCGSCFQPRPCPFGVPPRTQLRAGETCSEHLRAQTYYENAATIERLAAELHELQRRDTLFWCDSVSRFGTPLDPTDPVDRIVATMFADVTDRRGWRQEWDQFDEDVKAEIIATWCEKVRAALKEPTP